MFSGTNEIIGVVCHLPPITIKDVGRGTMLRARGGNNTKPIDHKKECQTKTLRPDIHPVTFVIMQNHGHRVVIIKNDAVIQNSGTKHRAPTF